jgi:hypothetical protein
VRRAWSAVALAALVLGAAAPARGQVFLAATPHPRFSIAPLFIVATVTPELNPVTVRLSWGLTPARGAEPADLRQAQYLLWPGDIVGPTAPGPPRPGLREYVESRGFEVVQAGRLLLRARGRDMLGTTADGDPIEPTASFVTFFKRGTNPLQSGIGTFIEIPWTPVFTDAVSLMSLTMRGRDLVTPKPAAWFEELFWGRRYIFSVGAGSAGSVALYALYLEQRERAIPLGRDFSLVIANFADADHLRIEEISPPTVTRRPSRLRAGSETVTLPLGGGEGNAPQVLRVQFNYYRGRIAWRPILISLLFLVLGNLMGAFMFTQHVARFCRRRFHIGRGARWETGVVLPPTALERIVAGTTTRDEVLALCGRPDEERQRLAASRQRTLVYRGTRRVPHRRFTVGWLSTVRDWEEEEHEVAITLDDDRVVDVQTRVRRARAK